MTRNVTIRRVVAIVAVLLLPLAVGGMYFGTVAGRANAAENIKAAVVNLDEMVTMEVNGTKTPMLGGRLVAQDLTAPEVGSGIQLDWTLTDEATARKGLSDGTYYAVVTIPKDFSAKLAKALQTPDTATPATVEVQANTAASPLAGKYGQQDATTATNAVSAMMTQQYLEGVFNGLSSMGEQISTATEGAGKLSEGSTQLKTGLDATSKGASSLAEGTSKLAAGTGALVTGTQQLDAGVGTLQSSVGQLSTGLSTYMGYVRKAADGVATMKKQAAPLVSGTKQLAQGASGVQQLVAAAKKSSDQAAAGITSVTKGMTPISQALTAYQKTAQGPLSTNMTGAVTGAKTAAGALQALNDACVDDTSQYPADACASIQAAYKGAKDADTSLAAMQGNLQSMGQNVGSVGQALQDMEPALVQANTGALTTQAIISGPTSKKLPVTLTQATAGLASGTADLADKAPQLVSGIGTLHTSLDALATQGGKIAQGSSLLVSGVAQLRTGTSALAANSTTFASGVNALNTGAGQLADGTTKLASGAGTLATGTKEFADGLSKSSGQVPSYTDSEVKQLATVVTTPVSATVAQEEVRTDDGGGSAAIIPIALWLGALGLFLLLRAVPRGVALSSAGPLRLMLAGYLPGAGLMAIAAVVLAVAIPLFGVKIHSWPALLALSLIGGLSFAAVNQALVALWGRMGSLISLAFFALQFACLDWVVPLQAAPAPIRALAPILPMSELGAALQGPMVGTAGSGSGPMVVGLVVWGLVGLAATAWVVRRAQTRAAVLAAPPLAQPQPA